jgi:ribose 5-phosphate isomerase B
MIAIGSDHGGYELKQTLITYFQESGYEYRDFGCFSPDSVDYPDIALPVSLSVANGEFETGILLCGTGLGVSIAANKVPGIRAALCSDCFTARMAVEHNNANVLCLGGRVLGPGLAISIVESFFKGVFAAGRHKVRVDKISKIEKEYVKAED